MAIKLVQKNQAGGNTPASPAEAQKAAGGIRLIRKDGTALEDTSRKTMEHAGAAGRLQQKTPEKTAGADKARNRYAGLLNEYSGRGKPVLEAVTAIDPLFNDWQMQGARSMYGQKYLNDYQKLLQKERARETAQHDQQSGYTRTQDVRRAQLRAKGETILQDTTENQIAYLEALGDVDTLTDAEKKNYKKLRKTIVGESAAAYKRGDKERWRELDGLVLALDHRTQSALASGVMGAVNELTFGAAEKAAQKANELYVQNVKNENVRNTEKYSPTQWAQAAHPKAYGVGSIAGSVAAMTGLGLAEGEILNGIKGFSSLDKVAKSMIQSGTLFGSDSFLRSAAKQDWDEGVQTAIGNVVIDTVAGTASGTVAGMLGGLTGQALDGWLRANNLWNNAVAVNVARSVSSTASAVGRTGTQEGFNLLQAKLDGEDYSPKWVDIGTSAMVAGLTTFVLGMINAGAETQASKARLEQLQREYVAKFEALMKGATTEERAARNVLEMAKIAAETNQLLTSSQFIGQQKLVDAAQNSTTANLQALRGIWAKLSPQAQQAALDAFQAERGLDVAAFFPVSESVPTAQPMPGLLPEVTGAAQGAQTPETAAAASVQPQAANSPQTAAGAAAQGVTTGGGDAKVVDGNGNLIYRKENAPTAIKTGVTAESGVTGTVGASEGLPNVRVAQPGNSVNQSGTPEPVNPIIMDSAMTREEVLAQQAAEAAQNAPEGAQPEIAPTQVQTRAPEQSLIDAQTLRDSGAEAAQVVLQTGWLPMSADVYRNLQTGEQVHFDGETVTVYNNKNTAGAAQQPQAAETMTGGTTHEKPAGTEEGIGNGEGRAADAHPGGQTGGLEAGTERRRAADRIRETVDLQNRVGRLRLDKVSARELGLLDGTDNKVNTVVPESEYTPTLRAAKQAVEEAGYTFRAVLGRIQTRYADVDGLFDPNTKRIIIRADATKYSAEQLVAHEMFHALADSDRTVREQAVRTIRAQYGEEEFEKVVQTYVKQMRGVYDAADEAQHALMEEEVLADAYAGMNRFGAGATRYTEAVRSAAGQRGANQIEGRSTQSRAPPRNRYSMAGVNARGADLNALEQAQEMKEKGESDEAIFKQTGWYVGADGEWRFEIDDSKMEFFRDGDVELMKEAPYRRMQELTDKWAKSIETNGEGLTTEEDAELERLQEQYDDRIWAEKYQLRDFIKHEELFRAYPALRYYSLVFKNMSIEEKGYFSPKDGTIVLNSDLIGDPRRTIIHEIQHVIQEKEGFARGASPKYWNDRMEEGFTKKNAAGEEMLPGELYKNTAGEIEARNVADRLNMTAEERRNRMPDRGDENTVFAEAGWQNSMDYDPETASIKDQLRNSIDELNEMNVVTSIQTPTKFTSKSAAAKWATNLLAKYGGKVDRQGYGEIYFSPKDINKAVDYADTNEEKAAVAAAPMVLKRGKEIGGHQNHKGREKQTITFAAPVALNGQRGNMAVVVNKNGNHYYTHRIVTPDGRTFIFNKEDAAQEPSRGVTVSGSLADTTSAASENNISKTGENVKTRFSPSEGQASEERVPTIFDDDYAEREPSVQNAAQYNQQQKALTEERENRLLGIRPEGRMTQAQSLAFDADQQKNKQDYAQELLNALEKPKPTDPVLELPKGYMQLGQNWQMQNTRQMQAIYARYAENTPKDRRLSEAEFWYMKQRTASGDFNQTRQAMSEEAEAIAFQDVLDRDAFEGTDALGRMGVKVARSVGKYANVQQLLQNDKAFKSVKRQTERTEARLQATAKEKDFAKRIAAGVYNFADIPTTMNADTILELADSYAAERSFGEERIVQVRGEIKQKLLNVMGVTLQNANDFKAPKAISLNYNTAQRNMRSIFGDELGDRIDRLVFAPVIENEGERIRFVNRQFDDVRRIPGKDGTLAELTKQESMFVQEVIEGRALEESVAALEMKGAIQRAAENIKNGKDAADEAREWGLSGDEKQMARKYARWLETLEALQNNEGVDAVRVDNAVKVYQKKFNEFYDAINDFLVAHGYQPIGFIKGYAPHLQSEENTGKLSSALKLLGINTDVSTLPTSIAGLTGDYKPNKKWNPYFLHRYSDVTDYDITKAYESYVQYMSEVFYHTDDVMTVRAMSDYLRQRYAPEDIRNEIDRIQMLRNYTTEDKLEYLKSTGAVGQFDFADREAVEAKMEDTLDKLYADAQNQSKYGAFVTYLDNYANILAGKQSMADRGAEAVLGRNVLNIGNKLTKVFGKAQVAGSVSSMMNQTAQLAPVIGEMGIKNVTAAVRDIMSGSLWKADFAQRSDFLTGKAGIDFLVTEPGEAIITKLFAPAEFVDSMMSTVAVRAAYLKAIGSGMDDKAAMKYADNYGRAVMGDRSKGAKPVAFHTKNPIMQMANIFQIEALNTWEHMAKDTLGYDLRQFVKEQGKTKAAAALAGVIVRTLLAAFVLNRLADELYGGTPAPFDLIGLSANFVASGEGLTTNDWMRQVIDNGWEKISGERLFGTEERDETQPFDWQTAIEDLGYNVSNDVPFIRNIAGLLGLGDETLPMPDLYSRGMDIKDAIANHGFLSGENAEAALGLVTEFVPAGRQISKSAKGTAAVLRGGSYSGYGDDARLRYPIDSRNPWTAARTILFGQNALQENERFYASGAKALTEEQTQAIRALEQTAGISQFEGYDLVQAIRKINADGDLSSAQKAEARRALINRMDIPDEQKFVVYDTLIGAKSDDLANLLDAGLTWNEITTAYDKYQELYADEDMRAAEQATAFAQWLDSSTGLSSAQKEAAKEAFTFYTMVPAEAGKYEALTEAGLTPDTAAKVTQLLKGLTPEEGKTQVTSTQKYAAILDSSLTAADKNAAVKTMIEDDVVTKLDKLAVYKVTYADYAEFKVKFAQAYPGKSVSQERAKEIITDMSLGAQQRAALWQMVTGTKKEGKNPFMDMVGNHVIRLFDWDRE